MLQFTDAEFSQMYISTIVMDFRERTIEEANKTIKLQIWDTAGQERYRYITSNYYRAAHGIAIVYDVTDIESFNNLESLLTETRNLASEQVKLIILANKTDLTEQRVVSAEMGANWANERGISHLEVCAKETEGVAAAFTALTRLCLDPDQSPQQLL